MSSLASRIRHCSQISGTFVLRSGKISHTYFDKYQFESEPRLLRDIAEKMAALVPPQTEALAGLEMGGIPVVTALSYVTGLPSAFIRKQPKTYGTCKYIEGTALMGKQFVLVEDVVSSGGAIIDALIKLRNDGYFPAAALCVIDRQTGGGEALIQVGLPLRALFTGAEIEGAGSDEPDNCCST